MREEETYVQGKDRLATKTVELNVEDILIQMGIPISKWTELSDRES